VRPTAVEGEESQALELHAPALATAARVSRDLLDHALADGERAAVPARARQAGEGAQVLEGAVA